MTITKDESIITQVAAKIAADLITKTGHLEQDISSWAIAFDAVKEGLFEAHAVTAVKEAFPGTVVETTYQQSPPPQPAVSHSLQIAGTQHGPLPQWLFAATERAGVSRVWDNRDKAVGTKRPWFKQADAQDGEEPAAFWPPKGQG